MASWAIDPATKAWGPRVLVGVVLLALSSGCATTYVPVRGVVLSVAADPAAPASQTKSGLTISVVPVDPTTMREKAPSYCADLPVAVCRPKPNEEHIGPLAVTWAIVPSADNPNVVTGCAPLVDLAFIIQIRNDTTHSIDLSTSVLQLEAADGTVYEPLQGSDRCAGSTAVNPRTVNPAAWPGAIRVLPGRSRDTFAAFCFGGVVIAKYPVFPLKLLIFDVPVETDIAGGITKRENFTYPVNGGPVPRFLAFGPGRTLAWSTSLPRCYDMDARGSYSYLTPQLYVAPVGTGDGRNANAERGSVATSTSRRADCRADCWGFANRTKPQGAIANSPLTTSCLAACDANPAFRACIEDAPSDISYDKCSPLLKARVPMETGESDARTGDRSGKGQAPRVSSSITPSPPSQARSPKTGNLRVGMILKVGAAREVMVVVSQLEAEWLGQSLTIRLKSGAPVTGKLKVVGGSAVKVDTGSELRVVDLLDAEEVLLRP